MQLELFLAENEMLHPPTTSKLSNGTVGLVLPQLSLISCRDMFTHVLSTGSYLKIRSSCMGLRELMHGVTDTLGQNMWTKFLSKFEYMMY